MMVRYSKSLHKDGISTIRNVCINPSQKVVVFSEGTFDDGNDNTLQEETRRASCSLLFTVVSSWFVTESEDIAVKYSSLAFDE